MGMLHWLENIRNGFRYYVCISSKATSPVSPSVPQLAGGHYTLNYENITTLLKIVEKFLAAFFLIFESSVLVNQHGVAKAEKAIVLRDSFMISS